MAIISTITKIQPRINLDNGTSASGNVMTVRTGFPTVSLSGYTDEKFYAVAEAVRPCLNHTIYSLDKVITYDVEEE